MAGHLGSMTDETQFIVCRESAKSGSNVGIGWYNVCLALINCNFSSITGNDCCLDIVMSVMVFNVTSSVADIVLVRCKGKLEKRKIKKMNF